MILPLALLASLLAPVVVHAQGLRIIPSSSIAQDSGYTSTALLLNPCLNPQAIAYSVDKDIRQQFTEARNSLPPETCSNPVIVEKIFRARFLQYASLALAKDPWNLDVMITAREQAFSDCRDTRCLEHELDSTIDELVPLYLNSPDPKWPSGRLCSTEPIKALPAVLTTKAQEEITNECGGVDSESAAISTCNDPHGKQVFAICRMQGNQVNAPQWLFREKKAGKKLLLYTNDGPFGVLETICNGMPDVLTTVRINAGEHSRTYYRFDGSRYQPVYEYTAISVGSGDKGDSFSIAQGAGMIQNSVDCR